MFVHLQLHSEYSLVDSTIRLPELIERCRATGMPAVALTDEMNIFALVKFFRASETAGIKPLAGADVWIERDDQRYHLTLLCQNRTGYLHLCRLLSAAYLARRPTHAPAIEYSHFEAMNAGLIALCGGMDGEIGTALRQHDVARARAAAERYARLLGDRFYLAISRCGREGEAEWAEAALDLAARLGLPAIASNDVRFLERADFDSHEARVAIHDGQLLTDPRRPRRYSPEQYLKSPAEMRRLFEDAPELIDNTVDLARRLNFEFELGRYHLPNYPTAPGQSIEQALAEAARSGLRQRLASLHAHGRLCASVESYQERLDTEVSVIMRMGFSGYFLIVADFIRWAKENDIPVGPGRGSGAGSLVAYALGITDLDPLRYQLLFERFLNPERVSMPDFDIDFCMEQRDRVIEYVAQRYGREQVSQIITFGSMAARAVLRDAGRVLGLAYGYVDRIAKLIPGRPLDLTLDDALGRSEKAGREPERIAAEFKQVYEQDEEVRAWVDLARKLEGLARNAGKHAGGVVIAPTPLTEFTALYCEQVEDGLVSQFDKDDIEAIGLVKFDFLGLRTLTVLHWARRAIAERRGIAVDLLELPLDDPATFELFCRGATQAVFQFESEGMRRMLREARPDCFEDLIALVSLYRPGPMDLIPSFIARKHGREPIEYPDPRVEPILRETYGIMVYQEQVMQLCQVLGGYSLGGADLLRRAIGKKKAEEMAKHRSQFRAGAAERGISADKADALFDLIEKFAGYGFNKSHAAAYALLSYQTAYLKTHYPAEFMAAVLSSEMDHTEKLVSFLEEARALGLTILPPDVNHSEAMFVGAASGEIRYGLGAIKGVGAQVAALIAKERQINGPYQNLYDFCARLVQGKLNRRVLEALIHAGALDRLGLSRQALLDDLGPAIKHADRQQQERSSGQIDLFAVRAESGTQARALSQRPEMPLLDKLRAERAVLGWYQSGHPLELHARALDALGVVSITQLRQRLAASVPTRPSRGQEPLLWLAGEVQEVRRRSDTRLTTVIEDGTGTLELGFFRDEVEPAARVLEVGRLVIIEARLSWDDYVGALVARGRRALPLEETIEEHTRGLVLHVQYPLPAQYTPRLRALLDAHRPGPVAVRIRLEGAELEASFDLSADWRIGAPLRFKDSAEAQGLGRVELAIARNRIAEPATEAADSAA